MASEYHSSSFTTNNHIGRFNSYKSNAFCAPRMGSLRIKAREQPASVQIATAVTATNAKVPLMTASHRARVSNNNNSNNSLRETSDQKLNTINLLKSIKSSQLSAATKSTTTTVAPTKPLSTTITSVNAFTTLGSNKSYYSSTRSFSSKIVDRSKLSSSSNSHFDSKSSFAHLSASSGTSSIESIGPKVSSTNNNGHGFVSGSKKRIYSSVRVTKKEMPASYHLTSDNIVSVNATQTANRYATTIKFTANKKQNNDSINPIITTMESNLSSTSSTRSTTTTSSSYSAKFPNGLPFEDEFYHKRRNSTSTKSEVSDYGSYENDDDDANDIDRRSLLPFEDEYACQRPSSNDEALYVDFSKPIEPTNQHELGHAPTNRSNQHFGKRNCNNGDQSDANRRITSGNNVYETKSISNRNYVCNPNEVIVRDQPVVYVAVQWWASATNNNCNVHQYSHGSHNNTTTNASHAVHNHYNCNVAEPITTDVM